jgi:hypothetical protein
MSTITTNLSLVKPALTDYADIAVINTNMDLLDVAVASKETPTGAQTKATAAQTAAATYTDGKVAALVNSSPGTLDTLKELADALGDDPNYATTTATLIGTKAPIASPALTGTPTSPTAAPGTNTTQIATTAFVDAVRTILANADALKAPLASPALSGTPTAPTAAVSTNTTQLATTAFVAAAVTALVNSSPATLDTLKELADALGDDPNFATTITTALGLKAPLVSPALTGVPTVPTAAPGTNTTQAASTAFVEAARVILAAADAAHLTDYVRQPGYAVATGSANTYAVTLVPTPTSYLDGMGIAVKINAANTGASTVNVNALGAKGLKDVTGSDFTSGSLLINKIYSFKYDSVSGTFIQQGRGGDPNLVTGNIRSGVSIYGIAGKTSVVDTSDATAIASQILAGLYAYVNGVKLTGTMASITSPVVGAGAFNPQGGRLGFWSNGGWYGPGSAIYQDDANFIASNILNTVSVFGVTGTAKRSATGSGTTTGTNWAVISGLPFNPTILEVTVGGLTFIYDGGAYSYKVGTVTTFSSGGTFGTGSASIVTQSASQPFTYRAYE